MSAILAYYIKRRFPFPDSYNTGEVGTGPTVGKDPVGQIMHLNTTSVSGVHDVMDLLCRTTISI